MVNFMRNQMSSNSQYKMMRMYRIKKRIKMKKIRRKKKRNRLRVYLKWKIEKVDL